MDIGTIITDVIVFILTVVFAYVWNTYIKPYLQDKHLEQVANIVVKAAESAYGAGHGDEKLAWCLAQINIKYGLELDSQKIINAVEAAWNTMNTQQITSGEKTIE